MQGYEGEKGLKGLKGQMLAPNLPLLQKGIVSPSGDDRGAFP